MVIFASSTSEETLNVSVIFPSFTLSIWKALANSYSYFLVSNTTSSRCLIALVMDSTTVLRTSEDTAPLEFESLLRLHIASTAIGLQLWQNQ